jgi:hypothetical protein
MGRAAGGAMGRVSLETEEATEDVEGRTLGSKRRLASHRIASRLKRTNLWLASKRILLLC